MTRQQTKASTGALNSLELLRFVAASMVVMAHLPPTDSGWLRYMVGAKYFVGSIGVDVFFVVSGVVMGLVVERGARGGILRPHAALIFLASRFFRIFPLYLMVTVGAMAVSWALGRGLPTDGHVFCSLILLPCVDNGTYPDPVIGAGWTLRYEVFFYALTAVAIHTGKRFLPVALLCLLVAIKPSWLAYYSEPIVLEFALGYMLAFNVPSLVTFGARVPRWLMWVSLLSSCALLVAVGMGKDFAPDGHELSAVPRMLIFYGADLHVQRFASWGVVAVLLTAICLGMERAAPMWAPQLGQLTYSIYMLEYFFLPISGRLQKIGVGLMPSIAATIALLGLGASLSYHLFEKPINSWWRRKAQSLS